MNGLARATRPRSLAAVLLGAALAACGDPPFDPFAENTVGPFAIYGYLDLRADTQWIRVTPIRHRLVPDAEPIDAVVTLEHLETGRVVTLRDSLFTFRDLGMDAEVQVPNFWTAEPLEPEATYRLVAMRSDGAATTATIEMPPDEEVTLWFREDSHRPGTWVPGRLVVQAEHLLYAEVWFTVWNRTGEGWSEPPVPRRLPPRAVEPGMWQIFFHPWWLELNMPPLEEMDRNEAHVVLTRPDWPYGPGLSITEAAAPGYLPTTVENGIGFVAGVALLKVPMVGCYPVEARPDGREGCMAVFDGASASIVGRVARDPCGDPGRLTSVHLTERHPGGGAVVWAWQTDWGGFYHFAGLEPGSELALEFGGHPAGTIHVPPLAPGERYYAPLVTMPSSCGLDPA